METQWLRAVLAVALIDGHARIASVALMGGVLATTLMCRMVIDYERFAGRTTDAVLLGERDMLGRIKSEGIPVER